MWLVSVSTLIRQCDCHLSKDTNCNKKKFSSSLRQGLIAVYYPYDSCLSSPVIGLYTSVSTCLHRWMGMKWGETFVLSCFSGRVHVYEEAEKKSPAALSGVFLGTCCQIRPTPTLRVSCTRNKTYLSCLHSIHGDICHRYDPLAEFRQHSVSCFLRKLGCSVSFTLHFYNSLE